MAAIEAGGRSCQRVDEICDCLSYGAAPDHPGFWGRPGVSDQRFAETATIACTLLLAPKAFWEPLSAAAKKNLRAYLGLINDVELPENNWALFRVMVNLCLERVGGEDRGSQIEDDLNRIEPWHLGDGWYSDGATEQRDHYVAFAIHFYCLLYAAFGNDPARGNIYRERAARFAQDYIHWFAGNGASLPIGRSLTYRFAQAAFWGALGFAGIEALPWGVLKGLVLRQLRWWMQQPILTDSGLLSIGYAYPNLNMAESYNSPASPYWAFKGFLPLALPESHPFWAAEELPLPEMPAKSVQPAPRLVICRDDSADHVVALAGGQWAAWEPRHVAEKYAKFCYSTHFAFSVPSAATGLPEGAFDSTLALSEEGLYFRVRRRSRCLAISERYLLSAWEPWDDVAALTWLVPAGRWHIRVHQVRTARTLLSAEGGFALDRAAKPVLAGCGSPGGTAASNSGVARSRGGISGIIDLLSHGRRAELVRAAPNTNLIAPQTIIPMLLGQHAAGEIWLACAVLGRPDTEDNWQEWQKPPGLAREQYELAIYDGQGRKLLAIDTRNPLNQAR
jgi:hypothetical protein